MFPPIVTKSDRFTGAICDSLRRSDTEEERLDLAHRGEVLPRCPRAASEEDLRTRDRASLEAGRVLQVGLPLAIEALQRDVKALVGRIKALTEEHPEKETIYALQDRMHRVLQRHNGLNTEAVSRKIMDCTYRLDHIGILYREAIKKTEVLEAMENLLALCQKEERAPISSLAAVRVSELEERLEITLLKRSAIEQLFSHRGMVSLDCNMQRALRVVLQQGKLFEERLHQRLDLLT